MLYVKNAEDKTARQKALVEFYRRELNKKYPGALKSCEALSGIKANECRIKNMKTRWGSCNPLKKRIWLSVRLACFDETCLKSVILHELCHIKESNHGKEFYKLLDSFDKERLRTEEKLKHYESTY